MKMRVTLKHILIPALMIVLWACGRNELSFKGTAEKVADGLNFPEGPVFAGNDLLFSNCYGMWIGRLTAEGRLDTFADLSGMDFKPNGLYWSDEEILWACEYNQGRILKFNASGEIVSILDNNGERFSRPNDITFYNGLIYFTDPKSYAQDVFDGRIYTLNPETEELRLFADRLAFPNGIAVSPDGRNVLVCESALNRIISLSIADPEKREVLVTLPGGDPDGIEFYDDKTLAAAHFGGGKIYIVNVHEKTLTDSLEFPGKRVTNCVFSPGRQYLYITEAETNSIYKIALK